MKRSIARIYAVVAKDFVWAQVNYKLLSLMFLPLFLSFFFSWLDSQGKIFSFSLIFNIAFTGLFTTSYFVVEEKNKGTLLYLLTTPLKAWELLVSKLVFNLGLCFIFSLITIVIFKRWDIFLSPIVLFNLVLFCGLTCFLGFTSGVFAKNEQELSIYVPFLLLFFCLGGAVDKVSAEKSLYAFFPDYHFNQFLSDIPLTFSAGFYHSVFNFVYFVIVMVLAASYTMFYFSNNREKRFSSQLVFGFVVFAFTLVVSGMFSVKSEGEKTDVNQLNSHPLQSDFVEGTIYYGSDMSFKPLLKMRDRQIYRLKYNKFKKTNFRVSFRLLENDEKDVSSRAKKVLEDKKRTIIGQGNTEISGQKFKQWTYISETEFVVLQEKFCDQHILQVSLTVETSNLEAISEILPDYKKWLSLQKLRCRQ